MTIFVKKKFETNKEDKENISRVFDDECLADTVNALCGGMMCPIPYGDKMLHILGKSQKRDQIGRDEV